MSDFDFPPCGWRASNASGHRGMFHHIVRTASLALLVALATLAASAGGASALIVHVHGRALSYQPLPGGPSAMFAGPFAAPQAGQPLTYGSGPVMPSNTNYALYWDPAGAPEYAAGYESGIDRYFEDLAHDSGGAQNTDSVLTQYGDSAGEFANYNSHFGGQELDTDSYPANGCSAAPICFTDEQLRAEIVQYVEAHKLPMDLEHEYFLLLPPGVESCLEAKGKACSAGASHSIFCSYHGFIPHGSEVVIYADIPYMQGTGCDPGEEHPNNNASDATLGGGLVHEHSESLTDPELKAWRDNKGEEVGDKCRTFKASTEFGEPLGKAPDGSNYNQVIGGDLYWYQQEWSNSAAACEQRSAQLPTVTSVAPKSGPATGGTSVTISGTGFVTGASVRFGATAAPEVKVNSSSSISAVSPAGADTVDVTVTTAEGTSHITKSDHFKYKKVK
jgi:IPT/TIG domain